MITSTATENSFNKNLIPIHDKMSQKNKTRKLVPYLDREHLQKNKKKL